jgi:hypothetical protein
MKLSDRFETLNNTRSPDLWRSIELREPAPAAPVGPRGRRSAAAIVALVVAAGAIALVAQAFIGMEAREPGDTASVQQKANGVIWFRVGGGDGPSFVYEVKADGSGQRLVFDSEPPRFSQIAWSPDGTRIAFVDPVVGRRGIYVANPDGSEAQRLTNGVNDGWPSWSPDGMRIAFSSTRYDLSIETCEPGADFRCPTDLYAVDAGGGNVTRLTTDPVADYQPAWSPDGSRIAFVRAFDGTATAIYAMDANGTDVRPVSSHRGGSDFSPSWSPNDSNLIFASIRHEDWGVFVVNADGTDERPILFFPQGGYVNDPVWSPDGELIAFVGGSFDGYPAEDALYVMRPDGSEIQRLSTRDLDAYGVAGDIAWQPIPVETTLGPTPTPAAFPSVSDPIPIQSPPGSVSGVAYGFGSVWVSSYAEEHGGRITRIDPASGEIVARISTGDVFPTWEVGGGGLTAGSESMWLAGAGNAPGEPGGTRAFLLRIDPGTNEIVARIDLGSGSGADVAIDDTGVWALSFSVADRATQMLVTRVDPTSNAVVATIPLDATYGHHIFAVQGSIVAQTNVVHGNTVAGTVMNIIDPATNSIETPVPLGTYASWPATAEDGLWALGGQTIMSIDPATGNVLATWSISNTGDAAAAGEGGVWFLDPSHRAAINRFDPSTGQVDISVRLNRDSTPIAMAVAPGSVWVLSYEGTVTRVGLN